MVAYILSFLSNLAFIDYIFFFTIIFLIILIVSLIYFIKINKDEEEEQPKKKVSDPDNLKAISEAIKVESKPITFTSYEKEQEEKAIISYDELVSSHGDYELNYSTEEKNDGVSIKKVDLDNLVKEVTEDKPNLEIHVISLKKEEEFLKALKTLQKNLN